MPETKMVPAVSGSLWSIDEELAALIAFREEREADRSDPPTEEELAVLDGEIQRYMQALPQKVTGVAGYIRHVRSQLDTILGPKDANGTRKGGEVGRLIELAKRIESTEKRVLQYVADVLEKQPQPAKGCKKLTGADGSQLLLRGNGGLQPLKIQEDILPAEYIDITVKMPLTVFRGLGMEQLRPFNPEPANARIRESLSRECAECHGMVGLTDETMGGCTACGNTGKRAVPGAWLEPRGQHVEIK